MTTSTFTTVGTADAHNYVNEFWRHNTSGEVFAVTLNCATTEGQPLVVAAAGPLYHSEVRRSVLAEGFDSDPELAEDIDNDSESYSEFDPDDE